MGATVQSMTNEMAFPDLGDEAQQSHSLLARRDLSWLTTASGCKIAAVHCRHPGATRTILFSHGNGELLVQFLESDWVQRLSTACAANVLVYDYCGFGISDGSKSEQGCYESIDAVYKYLLTEAKPPVQPSRLLVLGSSLGTAVSTDLVSRHSEIAGLALLSPLESGIRSLSTCNAVLVSQVLSPFDAFKNYQKIQTVNCPVLIMHGTDDDVIPIENGYRLYEACDQKADPLWIAGGDHCLSWNNPEVVWPRLRQFLDVDLKMT